MFGGVGMTPREGVQFLDGARKGVEEFELPRTRKDLVVPLHVEEHGNGDARGITQGASRSLEPRVEPVGLNPELSEDGTPQPRRESNSGGQAEPSAHGQPRVGEPCSIGDPSAHKDVTRGNPVLGNPIEDPPDTFGDDPSLILRRSERR